jgi:hypothetical protein
VTVHYQGDYPQGTARGYGDTGGYQVNDYQTTKTEGDLFPLIAYTDGIRENGDVEYYHTITTRTWHAGTPENDTSIGVLIYAVGTLGKPNEAQERSFLWLLEPYEYQLGRRLAVQGHCEVRPTKCPGERTYDWLVVQRQSGVFREGFGGEYTTG